MQRSVRRATGIVRGIDPWLMLALVGLVFVGVLMVYSSSMADAYAYYGTPYYFLQREIIWVVAGFAVMAAAAHVSYQQWHRFSLPFFAASVGMLGLVLVPHIGHISHGARRWLELNSLIAIEPSELVKLALVVYLASWLASKGERVREFQACFVPFSIMVGMIALMIIKQPDLGTSIVVVVVAFSIFFVAGANLMQLASVCGGSGMVAWMLMHGQGYRQDRLTAFLNPWHDPTGVGYHTIQALLALRYGGLFGEGLGNSTQKYVLPAPHTDSILAVIGEELGMVGCVVILLLFLVIAYRGVRIACGAPDTFGKLLAVGIVAWITFQALMNFAVITSSVPFTGVPLPFISYGGTSLVITMAAVGVLLNISRHASGEGFARQNPDYRRGDGRPRVPRVINRPVPAGIPAPSSGATGAELRSAPAGRRPQQRKAAPPEPISLSHH